MSFTFKKFVEFVDTEEPTAAQLNELFGVFRNNKAADDAQAKRDQLRQSKAGASEKDKELEWKVAQTAAKGKRVLTPAEKNRIKDKMFADAKARHDDSSPLSVRESEDDVLIDRPDYKLTANGSKYIIDCTLDGVQRQFTIDANAHSFTDESGNPVDSETKKQLSDQHGDDHVQGLLHIVSRHS
jgi:hypothetical protein